MNNKNYYSLAAAFITAALAMGSFTACSNEDFVAEQQIATQAKSYTVRISATMGEEDSKTNRAVEFGSDGSTITSQFKAGDEVYVYNETKQAFACSSDGILIPLTLTAGDISNGGRNCTLSGELTFYKADLTNPYSSTWSAVTHEASDTYTLFYKMNKLDNYYPGKSCFDYSYQDGSTSRASDLDFAMKSGITMTATGSTLAPTATVAFESPQSMFRQRLSFTRGPSGEGSTSPTIKELTISTKNGTLVRYYFPLWTLDPLNYTNYFFSPLTIDNPQITSNGDIYLSLAFDYGEGHVASGDELKLEAIDTEGHAYEVSKAVPTGGFVPGKYYYGSMTLAWKEQRYVKPTITPAVTPDEYNNYYISGSGSALAYTISGTSKGYHFYFSYYSSCSVTLSSLNAEYNDGGYITAPADAGLNIVVNGVNTVICPAAYVAIAADYGPLKLSGSGTLIVTSKSADWCGLGGTNYSNENNDHSTTTLVNVPNLAADGYTVTRSARTDNGDGTYTWTYTVAPVTL